MTTTKPKTKSLGRNASIPGTHALRLRGTGRDALVRKVKQGFEPELLNNFIKLSGVTGERLAAMTGIPKRTLARRLAGSRLTADESDRLLRVSRIFEMATELFDGDVDEARRWLQTPSAALGQSTPSDYVSTEVGGREVEQLIGRLMHGVFA